MIATTALPTTEMVPVRTDLADRYREEMPGAVRLAYLVTGDRALSEDLAQDAFIKVSARLVQLRDPGAFRAYLRRAVVNGARSQFRHQQVVRTHADRSQADVAYAAVAYNPDTDTRDELWAALETLPERQRAAIVCRYWLDLSEREIAHALSCRPGTVKSLLSRGLDALRVAVEAGEVAR